MDKDEITMDDLHQIETDPAARAQASQEMLPPAGSYRSTPDPEMGVSVERADDGRVKVTIHGVMEHRKTGRKAYIRARMSPEPRKVTGEVAGEEKFDFLYKVWATAENAYRQAFSEHPKNAEDVVKYLQHYPANYRVTQVGVPTKSNPEPSGEPGVLVVAVNAVRD